jgi:hypothetical protein
MKVPRATMFTQAGKEAWRPSLVPRYARRIAEVKTPSRNWAHRARSIPSG